MIVLNRILVKQFNLLLEASYKMKVGEVEEYL